MKWICDLKPLQRIGLLRANPIYGFHSGPESHDMFLAIRGILRELSEEPSPEEFREIVFFYRRLKRGLSVEAIPTANGFAPKWQVHLREPASFDQSFAISQLYRVENRPKDIEFELQYVEHAFLPLSCVEMIECDA